MAGSDGILSFGRGRGLAAMRACVSRFHRVRGQRGGGREGGGEIVSVSQTRESRERETARVCVRACVDLASVGECHLALRSACRMSILTRTSFWTSHRPLIPGESTSVHPSSSSLFVDRERYSPPTFRFWLRIRLPLKYPDYSPRRATQPHSILARFASY
jgi:hypothetical protein